MPRIFSDFQKLDDNGRLILSIRGAARDLASLESPKTGQTVIFYSPDINDADQPDDLEVEGTLEFDEEHNCWLGNYDPGGFRHASDRLRAEELKGRQREDE